MKKVILITLSSIMLVACGVSKSKDISNEEFVKEVARISADNNRQALTQSCLVEKSEVLTNKEKKLVLSVLDEILKVMTPPLTEEKKNKSAEILLKDKEVLEAYKKFTQDVINVCKTKIPPKTNP